MSQTVSTLRPAYKPTTTDGGGGHVVFEYVECHVCRYMRRVDNLGQVEVCPGCGDEEYIRDSLKI